MDTAALRAVQLHVRGHQVVGGQGAHEAQLACQHGGADDLGEGGGILSLVWVIRVIRVIRFLWWLFFVFVGGWVGRYMSMCGVRPTGLESLAPPTPNMSRHARWADKLVPPPTVPTCACVRA